MLEFRFRAGGFDMNVLEHRPSERVAWKVVEARRSGSARQSTGSFARSGDHMIVLFKHQGWKEPMEFMHHCSTKWAAYLMSLKKSLVETGEGAPAPRDLHIAFPD